MSLKQDGDTDSRTPQKTSGRFHASDADVTFVSGDNVLFHLHRRNLEMHATAFPPCEFATLGEAVPLTEDAVTLELLFQYVYLQNHPDLKNTPFEVLAPLAEAAEKYEIFSAMTICKVRMEQMIGQHPVELFNYACRHGHKDIMGAVIPHMLDIPLDAVVQILNPNLVIPWVRYRETWSRALHKAIKTLPDTYTTTNLGNHPECRHCNVGGRTTMRPRELWWYLGERRSYAAVAGAMHCRQICELVRGMLEDTLWWVPPFERFL